METYIFTADLPPWFSPIQFLCYVLPIRAQSDNDIALDGPETCYTRSARLACHRANGLLEWGVRRGGAVVGKLPMIQIALEVDEIGFGQMKEEIRSFRMQVPEGVAGAPEGVLLVYPLAFLLVLLAHGVEIRA